MTQPPQPPLIRSEELLLSELRSTRGDPFALQPGQELIWDWDFPIYILRHIEHRAERDHGLVLKITNVKHRVWRYQQPKQVRIRCRGFWSSAS